MDPTKPLPTETLAKRHIPTADKPIAPDPGSTTCPDGHTLPPHFQTLEKLGESLSSPWKKTCDELPDLGKLVWLFKDGCIWIGDRSMADSENWLWTQCDGQPYITKTGELDGDCLADDDYQPTHWMPLPDLPAVGVLKPKT